MILESLGQLLDVLRRPAGDFHAEMQAHLHQHFLDLVERLAAEVRRAQHLGLGLLHEVADVDDVIVLQAVRRCGYGYGLKRRSYREVHTVASVTDSLLTRLHFQGLHTSDRTEQKGPAFPGLYPCLQVNRDHLTDSWVAAC